MTDDLKGRLQKHNQGGVAHTSKYLPWKLRVAIAFQSREDAARFES
ncbi:MAG: GIY-YIG nuclease family protein [Kiritimatiellia bacterium]|nr:GIY-YIG nuclease family protein [Kiritimatiellia bacterium]